MLRGVIYARYSSDNQREESIDAQVYEIKEYARANNISIVKIYTDEAKSATTDMRPGFLQMFEEIQKGLFDVVLIHKLDRFARNRYDSAFYKRELKKAGVKLVSITEKLDDSPESVILESLLEGMSEYYSKNLARETMKGLRENARACKYNGGRPPIGLSVDPTTRQYIPGPEKEIATVRAIFELHAQGFGYGRITDELADRGYTTREGKRFTKNSLYDILRNEKYIGTYIYNRSASKSYDGKRNHHKSKPTEEMFRVEDAFPAIIDKDIFWRVQAKMDTNKQAPGSHKAKVNYLLAGLVFCGECHAALVGNSGSYKTKTEIVRYSYYECNKRDRQKDCDNPRIRKEILEDIVLDRLYDRIFAPGKISEIAREINDYNQSVLREGKSERIYLEGELSEIKKQIDNLVMAIANGAQFASLSEKLSSLEKQKSIYEVRIQEAEALARRSLITEDRISSYLERHREIVKNKSIDECKKVINNYIEKVVVYKDSIEVFFCLNLLDIDGGGGAYRAKSKILKKGKSHYPVVLRPQGNDFLFA